MRERFIELLSKQPEYNRGIEGTKINIHIPIRGEANRYCMEINKAVRQLTKSDIDFSPNSFHIPHITLYMGYVNSESDFDLAMEKIHQLTMSIPSTIIKLTKPYLKEPKKNYLFIDTNKTTELIKLKEEVKSVCNNIIEPLDWDVVGETPHITLAYIQNGFNQVNNLLSSFNRELTLDFNSIEISYCGPRGSCIGTIRAFELT